MCDGAELSGGAFKACRFARNTQKGLFTVVNHQGSGFLLYWQQNDLGEMTLVRQTKANCFAAPITAFDISPRGNFLGTGTSEGTSCSEGVPILYCTLPGMRFTEHNARASCPSNKQVHPSRSSICRLHRDVLCSGFTDTQLLTILI